VVIPVAQRPSCIRLSLQKPTAYARTLLLLFNDITARRFGRAEMLQFKPVPQLLQFRHYSLISPANEGAEFVRGPRKMVQRRNDYDVTNSVRTTDVSAVAAEVRGIYTRLYGKSGSAGLDQTFRDFAALYRGEFPGYRACDTGYHDIQHVLDVTLAMARLLDGYKRAGREPLDERMFRLGVILALYHDAGYIRRRNDSRHRNGAEYTLTHVSRSARFLRAYLPSLGMGNLGSWRRGWCISPAMRCRSRKSAPTSRFTA